MHTDDTGMVLLGLIRHQEQREQETGIFTSISRQPFEMKTHLTATNSIHWMSGLELQSIVTSQMRVARQKHGFVRHEPVYCTSIVRTRLRHTTSGQPYGIKVPV